MSSSSRIQKLQSNLKTLGVEALLISEPIDLHYFTNIPMTSGQLLIQKESVDLFVDSRYHESCSQTFPHNTHLVPETSLKHTLEKLQDMKLGFDSSTLTYSQFQNLSKNIDDIEPNHSLIPIKRLGQNQRIIKDSSEIEKLRKAAKLACSGFEYILDHIQEGISEKELTQKLHAFLIAQGAQSLSFEPIIAFGANTSRPHHHPSDDKLKEGDPILFDFGVNLNGYMSDMTRMVYFKKVNPKVEEIGQIVLEAQQAALQLCKPGVTNSELDKVARELIESKGYGDNFGHGLGHGVGLEIHELPVISSSPLIESAPLKQGTVFTVEPGIYLPGIGGVRIEDTVVLTQDGYETFTLVPPEPLEL